MKRVWCLVWSFTLMWGISNASIATKLEGEASGSAPSNVVCLDSIGGNAAGHSPHAIELLDLNQDLVLDLIVANADDQSVDVYRGIGNGTFVHETTITNAASGFDADFAAGIDYDGNTVMDILIVAPSSSGSTVWLYENQGSFVFTAVNNYSVGGDTRSVSVADFDGDSLSDFVCANNNSDFISIMLNAGGGAFTKFNYEATSGLQGHQRMSCTGDFDADGDIDIAVTMTDQNQVAVVFSTGIGTVDSSTVYPVGFAPIGITTVDLDANASLDLVCTNQDDHTITVLLNDGAGVFAITGPYATGQAPRGVVAGDVNLDGLPDIVSACRFDSAVSVLVGNGDGSLSPAVSVRAGAGAFMLDIGDIDGDQRLDLAVGNVDGNDVSILINCACTCPHAGDPDGSGSISFSDLLTVIGVAVKGDPPTFDPQCPRAWQDVNCDSVINIGDIIRVVDWAFGGVPWVPCDPCSCLTDPPSCQPIPPTPGQTIVVQSDTVDLGATNVTIGIYVDNDVPVTALVLPLEIREVTPGAYMDGTYELTIQGRVASSGLMDNVTKNYYDTPDPINTCSGPISRTFSGATAGPGVASAPRDAVSVFMFNVFGSCLSAGSDGTPGSGTPSFVLNFDVTNTAGIFEIDTCCTAPANHALLADCNTTQTFNPSFTKGVVHIDSVSPASRLVTERYLLACPRGDIDFEVTITDALGNPSVGYTPVWLDFTGCDAAGLIPQSDLYPEWPIVRQTAPADLNGVVRFAIAAGGSCADCNVTIHTAFGSKTVPVRSVDVDGDLCVTPADHDDAHGLCRDYNADGVVNDLDFTRHVDHCCDHCFPAGPCEYLSQSITLSPSANLSAGDSVTVHWSMANNNAGGYCTLDSVVLFQAEQDLHPIWERIGGFVLDTLIGPGDALTDSLVGHEIPAYEDICLEARLYNSCCDSVVETVCRSYSRQCPPSGFCYEFYVKSLADADAVITRWSDPTLLAGGWSYEVKDTTLLGVPVTMTRICTSEFTPVGSSGTLTIYYTIGGNAARPISYTVTQSYESCDISGGPNQAPDCVANVLDVVFLVNLVFRNGPPSVPPEHADITCDGVKNILDIVRIVDCIFRGKCPCPDCNAGPGPN